MPCPPSNTCAHQASRYLCKFYGQLYSGPGADMRNVGGYLRCQCGLMLRAHQMKKWAQSRAIKIVSDYKNVNGLYLIHQVNEDNGQGHVFVCHNGKCFGNGNYNWGSWTKQTVFRLQ